MRVLVDEMPEEKKERPFFVGTCYLNDSTTIKKYCRITKKVCDLNTKTGCRTTCSGLSITTDSRVMRYD